MRSEWGTNLESFQAVARDQLRALRQEARVTQGAVATEMAALGFGWRPQTVTDIEFGKRKVSIEEMVGLAIVFCVPVLTFVTVSANDSVALTPSIDLTAAQVRQLWTGETRPSFNVYDEVSQGLGGDVATKLWEKRRRP